MKKLLLILCMLGGSYAMHAQNYVIFLHNMYLELYGTEGVHPEYGKAEYHAIIDAFKKEGFVVISELRPKNTDGNIYAEKIKKQVDSLLNKGVPASHITVVGTSKGGYIAMYTSALIKNKDINYVFIGCCNEGIITDNHIHFYGNILSVYEESDELGRSCGKAREKYAGDIKHYKEIELHTGKKHGFLYKPLPEWIKPASAWAKQNYN